VAVLQNAELGLGLQELFCVLGAFSLRCAQAQSFMKNNPSPSRARDAIFVIAPN
jgi:hypothetical protein